MSLSSFAIAASSSFASLICCHIVEKYGKKERKWKGGGREERCKRRDKEKRMGERGEKKEKL